MDRDTMTGTFAAIDRAYGSFDKFVRDGMKITDADIASLRARLLE
jgi:protein-tyrosine phosphatase